MHSIIIASGIAIGKQAAPQRKMFDQIVSEFKPLLLILQLHALPHSRVWVRCALVGWWGGQEGVLCSQLCESLCGALKHVAFIINAIHCAKLAYALTALLLAWTKSHGIHSQVMCT
jgi:hypothetical protein